MTENAPESLSELLQSNWAIMETVNPVPDWRCRAKGCVSDGRLVPKPFITNPSALISAWIADIEDAGVAMAISGVTGLSQMPPSPPSRPTATMTCATACGGGSSGGGGVASMQPNACTHRALEGCYGWHQLKVLPCRGLLGAVP